MKLNNFPIRVGNYEEKVSIPQEFYQATSIIDIPEGILNINIAKDINQDYVLNLNYDGILILEDARSLDEVSYPIKIEFSEKIEEESEICGRFLKKMQNSLDILAILWENIVLEIPISYTEADELNIQGNGYNVGNLSEEDIDPRLAPLLELQDLEKE